MSLEIPSDEGKLYTIAPNLNYNIVAGRIKNFQILVVPTGHCFTVVYFDLQGQIDHLFSLELGESTSPGDVRAVWLAKQSFQPHKIQVLRFYFEELCCGIKQVTDEIQEAIDNPDEFTPLELDEILHEGRGWLDSGLFVLTWNEDFYMTCEGEVLST